MTGDSAPEGYAVGLPVLVRQSRASGLWEVYEWDAAAGLEYMRALYERHDWLRRCRVCGEEQEL